MKNYLKYIVILIVSVVFTACQSDSKDAVSSSNDIKEIYSSSFTLDDTLPKSISVKAGEIISFETEGNWSATTPVGSYSNNLFRWETKNSDVGQYTVTFSDDELKLKQDVVLNVTSYIHTPTITVENSSSNTHTITINTELSSYISEIFYATIIDGNYTKLESYEHILSEDSNSLTYYYKARIIDDEGHYSLYSDIVEGIFSPPAPNNISVSSNNIVASLDISWTNNYQNLSNLAYNLFRYEDCDSNNVAKKVNKELITTNSYRDENLTLEKSYCYTVSSIFDSKEGDQSYQSSIYTINVPTPSNLNFTTTKSSVTLTWDSIDGADSYEIYGSRDNYNFTLIGKTFQNNFTEENLAYKTVRYYKIKSIADDVSSNYSSTIKVEVLVAPPKNIIASQGEYSDKIILTWSKNSNADSYTLYRATSENGVYSIIKENIEPTTEIYTDENIEIDTLYYYKIASVYNADIGLYSEVVYGFYGKVFVAKQFANSFSNSYFLGSSGTDIYLSDTDSGTIYKVTTSGVKTTFLTGFSSPKGIAIDSENNIYVVDSYSEILYKISPDGIKTIFATGFSSPYGITVDTEGNVYVVDSNYESVYKISQDGVKTIYATGFSYPRGITIDSENSIYISDSGYDVVYKVNSYGVKTTYASGFSSLYGISVDTQDNIYVVDDYYDKLYKVTPDGNKTVIITGFSDLKGVTLDSNDEIYVSDIGTDIVYKIDVLKSKIPYSLTLKDGVLNWQEADGVVSYNIYSAISLDNNFTLEGNSVTLQFSPTDDMKYFYVTGVDSKGVETLPSNITYYIPTSPTEIEVSSNVDEVYLDWDSTNATQYNIYKEIDGSYTLIASVEDTDYIDSNVTFGETNSYKVTADFYNEESNVTVTSNISEQVTIASPKNVTVSQGKYSDKIVLSWELNLKADSYTIYRATSEKGYYSKVVDNLANTIQSYTDSNIDVDSAYFYKVVSVYNGVESEDSLSILGYYGSITINQNFSDIGGAYFLLSQGTDIYISDSDTNSVYKITADGTQTTIVSGMYYIRGLVQDSFGTLYVMSDYDDTLYKTNTDGTKTAFATGFSSPTGIAVDSKNNIYVADTAYDVIYKIETDGTKTTFSSGFSSPYAIAIDSQDNLYVTDTNYNSVYKIDTSGTKTTFATGFSYPYGIAIDEKDDLYIVDSGTDTLIKLTEAGTIKTVVGSGFYTPRGVTIDSIGTVFVGDVDANTVYKIVNLKSKVPYNLKVEDDILHWEEAEDVESYNIYASTSPSSGFSIIGESNVTTYIPSDAKKYFYVKGVYNDGNETLASTISYYVPTSPTEIEISSNVDEVYLDWNSTNATQYNIYKDVDGEYRLISTVTDTNYTDTGLVFGDYTYYKITASFYDEETDINDVTRVAEVVTVEAPKTVNASDGEYSDKVVISWSVNTKADSYNLYRATSENGTYSVLIENTTETTFDDTTAIKETIYYYKIRSVYNDTEGDYSNIEIGYFGSTTSRTNFVTSIYGAKGMVMDSHDNLFVVDDNNNYLYKIAPDGTRTTFATGFYYPYGIAIDSVDNLYVTDYYYNKVYKITAQGIKTELSIDVGEPRGVVVDSLDNIYVVDNGYNKVHKIDTNGAVSTYISALTTPMDITVDSKDNIYISDSYDDKIWKYLKTDLTKSEFATGFNNVTFISFDADDNLYISDDGADKVYKRDFLGLQTEFASYYEPNGITFDSKGDLYLAESYNNIIYRYTIQKSYIPYNLALNDTTLSWSQANDAVEYEIFSSSSQDGTYSLFDTTTNLNYELETTGDYYKVRAKFADGSYSELTYEVN